jgi:hypothetical protein
MSENNSAPEDVEKILATIRQLESSNNYEAKAEKSSASGAYQFIDPTWRSYTKKYGIGTEYPSARLAPPKVQDKVASLKVQEILTRHGGDVSKVPLVWYTGNPQGSMTQKQLRANQGQTAKEYKNKWFNIFNSDEASAPVIPEEFPEPRSFVPTAASVKPETRVSQAEPLDQLPESYRLALAANYLADTEDEPVVEKAMEMLEEREYEASTGGGKIPALAAFGQQQQSVDPFQFVLAQAEQEPRTSAQRRTVVPRMPQAFAEGGLASRALMTLRPKLTQTDSRYLQDTQKQFDAYNAEADKYQAAVDAYNAQVDAYNAAQGRGVAVPGSFTMKEPTLPGVTVEQAEAYQKAAQERAKRLYAARTTGLQNIINPRQYNLSGMAGASGTTFSFADGGSVGSGAAAKSGVNRLKQARAVPAMPRFQDGGEVDITEQMTVGTLPEQVEPSPVDTAVNDYLRMQSQLFTDPKAWFQQSGQRLAETIERDPEEFALGFTGAGIGGILKPKGGTFLSGPASNFESGMDGFKGILEARIRRNPGTPLEAKGKAAMDFFDKQFKNFYQRRLGSQDDPLREAFVRGEFKGKDMVTVDDQLQFLDRQREVLNSSATPEQKIRARRELEQFYDNWVDINAVLPETVRAPDLESIVRRQAKFREQGADIPEDLISRTTADLPVSEFDPRSLRAIREKDVAYDAASPNVVEDRMRYLDDYLTTLSPQQIKNIRFEDAMIQAEKYHELLERAANRQLTPKELFGGREKVLDVGDRRWSDIKDPKALEIEAQFMDHCIGGAGYCEELTSGVGRHFSLQDVKTGEPHVTMSVYRSPFSESGKHVIVRQIKGKSNSAPEKYFPEVEKFLEDYEKRVGKIFITENRKHIPPSFRGAEYTEIPRAFRGNE